MNNVKVGVCGLGNMGLQVASRIARVHTLKSFDISVEARNQASSNGLDVADNLSEMGDRSIVVLSLPHSKASLATVRELATLLAPGSVVIETSTVAPADIEQMSEILAQRDIGIIDAAIVTGVPAMAAGTTALLVGSEKLDSADPVMQVIAAIATDVTWTGKQGSAMALKVIHNAVAHATMVTLAEARGMGLAYGISEQALVDVLRGDTAGLLRPLLHRLGERVASGNYEGGMSLAAARKDSLLALGMAAEHQVPLYSIAASHTVYENAVNRYSGRDDYAVIAELWSKP